MCKLLALRPAHLEILGFLIPRHAHLGRAQQPISTFEHCLTVVQDGLYPNCRLSRVVGRHAIVGFLWRVLHLRRFRHFGYGRRPTTSDCGICPKTVRFTWGLIYTPSGPKMALGQLFPFSCARHLFLVVSLMVTPCTGPFDQPPLGESPCFFWHAAVLSKWPFTTDSQGLRIVHAMQRQDLCNQGQAWACRWISSKVAD